MACCLTGLQVYQISGKAPFPHCLSPETTKQPAHVGSGTSSHKRTSKRRFAGSCLYQDHYGHDVAVRGVS